MILTMQHLRSLEIDSSDSVGEGRSKKREYRFYLNRADGRYVFKVSIHVQDGRPSMSRNFSYILEMHG